jgi:type II secretory pathway component PulF
MLVARQMALLCRAGVPLLAACEVLLRQAGGCRWGREMARVRRDLAGGASPSAALGRHPRLFPPWAEAVLRAAEASGTLPEALEGLARSYERSLRTRRQLVTAARYPALVLATALVANLVLLRWFAPAFERAFEQAGLALPGLTRWLLAGAEILGRSSTWVTVALAAMALFGWLGSQAGRQSLLHLLPRLPGLGRLWSMAEMAEVFSALSGMLAAGVRMQEALGRVVQVAFFPRTRASLLEVRRRVLGGTPLSQALSAEVFGPAAGHLLRASEEAGDHAGMLRRLAEGLSLDLEVALEAWTAALSPLLIALVGLAIALMVLALFLPLYSAMASFA